MHRPHPGVTARRSTRAGPGRGRRGVGAFTWCSFGPAGDAREDSGRDEQPTDGPAMSALAPLPRRLLAEGVGTGMLVAVVVGAGIAASRLSPHDVGAQLFYD